MPVVPRMPSEGSTFVQAPQAKHLLGQEDPLESRVVFGRDPNVHTYGILWIPLYLLQQLSGSWKMS